MISGISARDLFGDLRSLLMQPPTPVGWRSMCGLLERWAERAGFEERVMPYVMDHLAPWDDTLRVAPLKWGEQLMKGRPTPQMLLAATLDLTGRHPIEDVGAEVLASSPWVANLRRLVLGRQSLGVRAARALARSEHLGNLTSLDLHANHLHGAGVRVLCNGKGLAAVKALNLHHNQLDGRDVEVLVRSSMGRKLERVNLSGNDLSPAGLLAISRSPEPLAWRALLLNTCSIRWAGAKALGDAAHVLPKLHTLSLNQNALTHDTISALFRFVPWHALRSLSLYSNWLGVTGVRMLAATKSLSELEELELSNNSLKVAGVEQLAHMQGLHNLRALALSSNAIGDDGARALSAISELEHLDTLDLSRNEIGVAGVMALVHAPWRGHIRELNLQHNALGDRGVEALLHQPWPNLERLVLRFVCATDRAAHVLAATEHLPSLKRLDLDFNDISVDGVRELARAPHLSDAVRDAWRARLDGTRLA
ncbi:MAG: hypothetical protein AAGI01_15810 [Myxococcota bacterium]